jgi:hypothetical protein
MKFFAKFGHYSISNFVNLVSAKFKWHIVLELLWMVAHHHWQEDDEDSNDKVNRGE